MELPSCAFVPDFVNWVYLKSSGPPTMVPSLILLGVVASLLHCTHAARIRDAGTHASFPPPPAFQSTPSVLIDARRRRSVLTRHQPLPRRPPRLAVTVDPMGGGVGLDVGTYPDDADHLDGHALHTRARTSFPAQLARVAYIGQGRAPRTSSSPGSAPTAAAAYMGQGSASSAATSSSADAPSGATPFAAAPSVAAPHAARSTPTATINTTDVVEYPGLLAALATLDGSRGEISLGDLANETSPLARARRYVEGDVALQYDAALLSQLALVAARLARHGIGSVATLHSLPHVLVDDQDGSLKDGSTSWLGADEEDAGAGDSTDANTVEEAGAGADSTIAGGAVTGVDVDSNANNARPVPSTVASSSTLSSAGSSAVSSSASSGDVPLTVYALWTASVVDRLLAHGVGVNVLEVHSDPDRSLFAYISPSRYNDLLVLVRQLLFVYGEAPAAVQLAGPAIDVSGTASPSSSGTSATAAGQPTDDTNNHANENTNDYAAENTIDDVRSSPAEYLQALCGTSIFAGDVTRTATNRTRPATEAPRSVLRFDIHNGENGQASAAVQEERHGEDSAKDGADASNDIAVNGDATDNGVSNNGVSDEDPSGEEQTIITGLDALALLSLRAVDDVGALGEWDKHGGSIRGGSAQKWESSHRGSAHIHKIASEQGRPGSDALSAGSGSGTSRSRGSVARAVGGLSLLEVNEGRWGARAIRGEDREEHEENEETDLAAGEDGGDGGDGGDGEDSDDEASEDALHEVRQFAVRWKAAGATSDDEGSRETTTTLNDKGASATVGVGSPQHALDVVDTSVWGPTGPPETLTADVLARASQGDDSVADRDVLNNAPPQAGEGNLENSNFARRILDAPMPAATGPQRPARSAGQRRPGRLLLRAFDGEGDGTITEGEPEILQEDASTAEDEPAVSTSDSSALDASVAASVAAHAPETSFGDTRAHVQSATTTVPPIHRGIESAGSTTVHAALEHIRAAVALQAQLVAFAKDAGSDLDEVNLENVEIPQTTVSTQIPPIRPGSTLPSTAVSGIDFSNASGIVRVRIDAPDGQDSDGTHMPHEVASFVEEAKPPTGNGTDSLAAGVKPLMLTLMKRRGERGDHHQRHHDHRRNTASIALDELHTAAIIVAAMGQQLHSLALPQHAITRIGAASSSAATVAATAAAIGESRHTADKIVSRHEVVGGHLVLRDLSTLIQDNVEWGQGGSNVSASHARRSMPAAAVLASGVRVVGLSDMYVAALETIRTTTTTDMMDEHVNKEKGIAATDAAEDVSATADDQHDFETDVALAAVEAAALATPPAAATKHVEMGFGGVPLSSHDSSHLVIAGLHRTVMKGEDKGKQIVVVVVCNPSPDLLRQNIDLLMDQVDRHGGDSGHQNGTGPGGGMGHVLLTQASSFALDTTTHTRTTTGAVTGAPKTDVELVAAFDRLASGRRGDTDGEDGEDGGDGGLPRGEGMVCRHTITGVVQKTTTLTRTIVLGVGGGSESITLSSTALSISDARARFTVAMPPFSQATFRFELTSAAAINQHPSGVFAGVNITRSDYGVVDTACVRACTIDNSCIANGTDSPGTEEAEVQEEEEEEEALYDDPRAFRQGLARSTVDDSAESFDGGSYYGAWRRSWVLLSSSIALLGLPVAAVIIYTLWPSAKMAAGTDAKASGAAEIGADDKLTDHVVKGKGCDERTDQTTNALGPILPITAAAASSAPDASAAGMFGRIASCAKQSMSWVCAPDGVVILCVSALAVVAFCDSADLHKHTRGGGVRHGGRHSSGHRTGHVPITDLTWGVSPAIFEWAAQLVPVFLLAAAGFEATVAIKHRKATGHPPLLPLLVSGLTLHLAVHAAVSVASSPRGRASRDATTMTDVTNRPEEEAVVSMSWHVAVMRVVITSLTYPVCIALVVRPLQRAMLNAKQQGKTGPGNQAVMVLVSLFCAISLGLTAFGPMLFTVLVDSGIAFATCGAAIAGARLAGEGKVDNDAGSCPPLRQQNDAPPAATVDKRKRVWVGITVGCGLLLTLSCMVEVWAGWKGSVASLTCIVAAAALVLQFGDCVLVCEPCGRVESAQSDETDDVLCDGGPSTVSTGTARIHSRRRYAALGSVVCGIIVSPLLKVLLKRQSAMTWMSSTVTFVWYDAPLIILWYGICIGPLAVLAYHCTSAEATALVAVARRVYQLRDDIRHWMALPAEPPPAVLVPWLRRGKTCLSSLCRIARGAVRKGRRFLARWLPAVIVVSLAALVLWVHLRSLPLVFGRVRLVSAESKVSARSQPVANPTANGSSITTHTASRANFPSTNPPVYMQLGHLLWQCLWFAAAVLPLPHLVYSLCRHVLSAVGRSSGGIPALDSDAALFDDDTTVHRVPLQQSETKHNHAAQVDPTVSSSIRAVPLSRVAARPGMMTTGEVTFIDGVTSTRSAFTHVLFFRIHVGGLVEAGGSGAGNQVFLGHVAAALDHLLEVLGTCLRPNKWKVELVTPPYSTLSLSGLVASSMAPTRKNRLAQACGSGQVVHLASSSIAAHGSDSSDDRTDTSMMDLWRVGEACSSAMADDWVVHLPLGCRVDTGFVRSVYDRAAAQHLHRSSPEIAVTAAVYGSQSRGGIFHVRKEGGEDGDGGDDLDFATPAQCIVAHAQAAHAADYFGYLRGEVRAYGHLVGAAAPRGLPVGREGRGGDSNASEAEAVHRTVLGLTPDGFLVPVKDTLYGEDAAAELARRETRRVTARSALGRALSTACPADDDLVTAMSTATLRGLLRSALEGVGSSLIASGGCGTVVPLSFSGTRVGGAGDINTAMWAHQASERLGEDGGGRRSHTTTVPALLSGAVVRGIRMSWLDALVVNHDVKSMRSFWKARYDAYDSWWSAGDHLYDSIHGGGGGGGDSGGGGRRFDTAVTGITRMVRWRWRLAVAHQALLPCSFALLMFGGATSRWIGSGTGGEGWWGGVFGPTNMIGTMTCALHVWRYAFGWICAFRLSTQGVLSTGLILARHVAVLPVVVVFEAAVAFQWIFQRALVWVAKAWGACSRRRGWAEIRCGGGGGGEVEVMQDAVLSPA